MQITLLSTQIEIFAVLAATLSAFAIGMIYYSPMVVGSTWMKLVGLKKDFKPKGMALSMTITLVMAFVTFGIFALLWPSVGAISELEEYPAAILTAILLWTPAFYVTGMNNVYAQRSMKLTLIDTTYVLVNLIIGGLLIALIS